jgi:cytochrome c oxidase subunit 2
MSNLKHAIGALIFIVVLTAIGLVILNPELFLPPSDSIQARPIDNLLNIEFKLIAFLFALIIGIMLYSVIFFRRKKDDLEDGPHITGNMTLEIVWTLIPLITVIALAFIGTEALAKTQLINPQALEVKVIGQQWSWRFEYPEYGVTSEELVLPVKRQALIEVRSIDVIHSFWVPEFRIKQDALPGSDRELRITPTKEGEYKLLCAEMCGEQHAYMTSPVRVVSKEAFDTWVAEQLTSISDDPGERGLVWYQQYGCDVCHSIDGSELVGPTFSGLYDREEIMADGTAIIVDEEYLFEAIRDPGKVVVDGYPDAMPPGIADDMTDEQVFDVIEFIKSLK